MDKHRVLRTLMLGNFFMALGFNIWLAVFNNFAVEELAVRPEQMGFIQSVREVPGFLGFGMGLLALLIPELRLAAISVIVAGLGLILMSFSTDAVTLLTYTLVFSVGFHLFHPASSSVALIFSGERETAPFLGKMLSVGAVAAVAATTFVFFAVEPLGFRPTLVIAGAVTIAGGLFCVARCRGIKGRPERMKVVFRRRYWLFYTLTLLMGSRRHIFSTFAIFLLVNDFGISTRVTAVLFLVTSLLTTYTARVQGRVVANLGERTAMSAYFFTIALICLGYAYVAWLPLLYVLFVSDHVLAGFDLALNSYFRRIAPPTEVTANMSMSQTINHVSALFVPAVGGLIWRSHGSGATFLFGVAVSLLCLLTVQWMKAAPAPALQPAAAAD